MDDADQIGRQLERERVITTLQQVQGLGPQRITALADQYGTLWNLRQADVDDLVASARIPRPVAERIKSAL